jgi:DNA-binding MarR family transcriptional regulator
LPAGGQLTGNEDAVLRAILALQTAGAAITYSTIAERSGVPKTSIGWFAGSLERKGWLRRSGPAGDRRYEVLAHPDGEALPQRAKEQPAKKQPNRQFNMRAHRERDHDRKRAQSRAAAAEGTCTACGQKPQQPDDELCADCAKLVTRAGKPASAYGGEPGNLSRTSGGTEADNIVTSG